LIEPGSQGGSQASAKLLSVLRSECFEYPLPDNRFEKFLPEKTSVISFWEDGIPPFF